MLISKNLWKDIFPDITLQCDKFFGQIEQAVCTGWLSNGMPLCKSWVLGFVAEAAALKQNSGLFNNTYKCKYQESPAFASNPKLSFMHDFNWASYQKWGTFKLLMDNWENSVAMFV